MNEREAYILLNMMEGVGPVSVRKLAECLGSVSAILAASAEDLARADGVGRELARRILEQRGRFDVEHEQEQAEKLGAHIVTFTEPEYPDALRGIHDPPLALYVQGALETRDRHGIAVVGTRRASHYGRAVAERFGYRLAQSGFTVVSGLARGVDTAAHRGALKAQGRTIAVVGSALDRLYPPENDALAREIAEQGAVLSEFRLGTEPGRTTFPMRNRIVSGMAMGVMVVEADLKSGAMITARQAAEQGRSVFAVPGRIDSHLARGCHDLIKNGAILAEDIDDVTQEFEFLFTPAQRQDSAPPAPQLSPEESAVLQLLESSERDVDQITRESGLGSSRVGALLLGLEMKRLVRMLPGRIVQRVQRL